MRITIHAGTKGASHPFHEPTMNARTKMAGRKVVAIQNTCYATTRHARTPQTRRKKLHSMDRAGASQRQSPQAYRSHRELQAQRRVADESRLTPRQGRHHFVGPAATTSWGSSSLPLRQEWDRYRDADARALPGCQGMSSCKNRAKAPAGARAFPCTYMAEASPRPTSCSRSRTGSR